MRTAIAPSSIAPYRTLRAPFVNGERRSRPRLPKEGYARIAAPPGLHTMRSLALPSFAGGKWRL